MKKDEQIEFELRESAEEPERMFVLGDDEDWVVCSYHGAGQVRSIFVSDIKADALRQYLRSHGRIFKNVQEAQNYFESRGVR